MDRLIDRQEDCTILTACLIDINITLNLATVCVKFKDDT